MGDAQQDFLRKLNQDPAFSDAVRKAVEGLKPEQAAAAAAQVAQEHGFAITADELAAHGGGSAGGQDKAELTEAELDTVAGGANPWWWPKPSVDTKPKTPAPSPPPPPKAGGGNPWWWPKASPDKPTKTG